MRTIVLDFETYYDKEYTLKKLTNEEYINDPRFEVIGVSIKQDDDLTVFYPGPLSAIQSVFNNMNWDDAMVVAHNSRFDMAILAWKFGVHPKAYGDTLSMARAVHGTSRSHSLKSMAEMYGIGEKGTEVHNMMGRHLSDLSLDELRRYGDYCKQDSELCWRLFHKMLDDGFPKKELKLIDMTIRMYTDPVFELDLDKLEDHLQTTKEAKEKLLANIEADKKTLMSNPKFAKELVSLGVTPPKKISKTTGKETFAFAKTDEGMLALLNHEDVRVQALVAARLGAKSTQEESRTERLIGIANRMGTLPVPLKYFAAISGRWGGDDLINMQNLRSRGGNDLKQAIKAAFGYVVINSDSSQIEARGVAWLAGQLDLVQAFADKKDVYKIMASSIYNKLVEEIDKHERFIGKTVILGAGYGMGAQRFLDGMILAGVPMELDEARHIIRTYRERNYRIAELWRKAQAVIEAVAAGRDCSLGVGMEVVFDGKRQGFQLPTGIWVTYPNLRMERQAKGYEAVYDGKRGPTRLYGPKLVENITQSLTRCVIGEQMIRINKRGVTPAMTVHDSIVAVTPRARALETCQIMAEEMRTNPEWSIGLPLNCEVDVGKSYGKTIKVDV